MKASTLDAYMRYRRRPKFYQPSGHNYSALILVLGPVVPLQFHTLFTGHGLPQHLSSKLPSNFLRPRFYNFFLFPVDSSSSLLAIYALFLLPSFFALFVLGSLLLRLFCWLFPHSVCVTLVRSYTHCCFFLLLLNCPDLVTSFLFDFVQVIQSRFPWFGGRNSLQI